MINKEPFAAITVLIIGFLFGASVMICKTSYEGKMEKIRLCEEKLLDSKHCELIAVPIIEATHEN